MKKLIVMMGGQGVGKGTFSHMLADKYGFRHVETGAMLRSAPADSDIAKTIARGELVPDEMLFDMIASQIGNGDVILDGFPRTLGQAKWLIEKYSDIFNIQVIFLDITEEKMMAHIKKRIKEGGNRADDMNEESVRKRITAFKTTTMPAIQWLSGINNIKFFDIVLQSDDIETNFNYIIKNTGIKK